mgnify:CR=1 FL=1
MELGSDLRRAIVVYAENEPERVLLSILCGENISSSYECWT